MFYINFHKLTMNYSINIYDNSWHIPDNSCFTKQHYGFQMSPTLPNQPLYCEERLSTPQG
jgi:hypothetical protein